MPVSVFASQAATLYSTYHRLQILIHRPFIVVPRGLFRSTDASAPYYDRSKSRHSKLSDSALCISLNSANACAHILEVQMQRGMSNVNNVVHSGFICCGLLLIHWWGSIAKESTGNVNAKDVPDSHVNDTNLVQGSVNNLSKFIRLLENASSRWPAAAVMV